MAIKPRWKATKGNVLLLVNVASKCGLTPQYEQLENIQKAWEKDGFTVLGFPCNQFLGQEPGSEEEIKTFCSTTYGVTFPLFSKIDVNGEDRHPLYAKLIAAAPKPLRRKAAVFTSVWPAKAARRFIRTISCGTLKNS
jgi:glutathione peroxidase